MNDRDVKFWVSLFLTLFFLAIVFRIFLSVIGYRISVPILDPILYMLWTVIGRIMTILGGIQFQYGSMPS